MSRSAALILASLLVCGCQNTGQPYGAAMPFGNQRIPPPGTNAYPKPDIYYPGGSNPAGTVGSVGPAGNSLQPNTTPTGLSPASLFNTRPQTGMTPTSGNGWPPETETTQPAVRFGDNRAPAASSAIRLNGMPVNDATRPPMARSTPVGTGIPEITDLPRGTTYGAQPAGYLAPLPPNYPPYNAPYGAAPQYYAPGSIGQAAASSSSSNNTLGWKSKSPTTGSSSGTTLR